MTLGPPWIIFADRGKPIAILPAGRPGEVANVEGLSMKTVQAIVSAANERERGFYEKFDETASRIEKLVSELGAIDAPTPHKKRKRK